MWPDKYDELYDNPKLYAVLITWEFGQLVCFDIDYNYKNFIINTINPIIDSDTI
jgi:hypothetical protein